MLTTVFLSMIFLLLCPWGTYSVGPARGKRVVMMPNPLTSHSMYHSQVARALHRRGHDVFVTMPDYIMHKGQVDVTNITVIEYNAIINVEEAAMNDSVGSYFRGASENFLLQIGIITTYCDSMLRNQTLFRQIRHLQPDLIVIDNLPQVKMLAVLPYRMGVPFAFLGSIYLPLDQRVPFSPAVLPLPILKVTDHMSFFQRVLTTLITIGWSVKDPFIYSDAVARYAPEKAYISADMVVAGAEMWLVEMDHILDYPRPTLPNVRMIGGTATGPPRPLTGTLRHFLDSAPHGVILVSFGSYVLNVPTDISDKLWTVFSRIPYKVVFRSNLTSPSPDKVYVSTWIPQNDILGHPKMKAFVSHCGKNGQYEALYHAVPVVAVPIFGDQVYNAERMRVKGFAEVMDLLTSTVEEMVATIMKVAGDPKYKQTISVASHLFRQQYHVPMEEAAFWLDHVMQYGGAYMRSSGQQMPLYQFLLVDVIAFLIACFLACLLVLLGTLYILFKLTCSRERRNAMFLLVLDCHTVLMNNDRLPQVYRRTVHAVKLPYLTVGRFLVRHQQSQEEKDR